MEREEGREGMWIRKRSKLGKTLNPPSRPERSIGGKKEGGWVNRAGACVLVEREVCGKGAGIIKK